MASFEYTPAKSQRFPFERQQWGFGAKGRQQAREPMALRIASTGAA